MKNINQTLSSNKLVITKKSIEYLAITFLFLLSFLHPISLLIFFLLLFLLLFQKEIGAIKILNLLTLRSVINPGIAVGFESLGSAKLIAILIISLYLNLAYLKLDSVNKRRVNYVLPGILLYYIYNIGVALFQSSLPIVAILKATSYTVCFTGVVVGVAYTYMKFNWLKWVTNLFILLALSSIVMFTLPEGYMINGVAFQGITNQPNMFGILMVMLIGAFLAYATIKENMNIIYFITILSLGFFMILASESRTSLLSSIFLLIIYYIVSNFKKATYFRAAIIPALSVIFIFIISKTYSFFIEFMVKGQTTETFFVSRENQIGNLLLNFEKNPILGNGFSVPVLPTRTYSFDLGYLVEPGNLFLSVLSYSGVMGFLIFLFYMVRLFWLGKKNISSNIYLFLAPILISMGEMVFFSSNSIGVWCYMFLALYVFAGKSKEKEIL